MRRARLAFLLLALSAGAGAVPPGADELLASTLPEKREEGAALLGKQGDIAAAKRLIALLDDPDWGVQMAAIRNLAPIKFEDGRDAIREKALEGAIRAIRVLAARCLKEHDAERQASRIATNLVRLKGEARIPALDALGILGTPEAVEALSDQMRAPEPEHRSGAARALGRLHGGEKGLIRGLKDKEEEVVILSAIALAGVDSDSARAEVLDHVGRLDPVEGYVFRRVGRRGGEVNREAFAKALEERIPKAREPAALLQVALAAQAPVKSARAYFGNSDPLTRVFAYKAAAFGTERVTPEEAAPGLADKDRRVRIAAAEAVLAGTPPPEAVNALLAHRDADVAMVAVRRAFEMRMKDALPAIAALAKGEAPAAKRDWPVRAAACVALGRIGWEKEFDTLAELAKAREWQVRAAACEGLYHAYDKRAIPILIAAFNDKQPVARMTARKNLRNLTRQTFAQKQMYEGWWEKQKDKLELEHPEKRLEELDKYGYDTKKYLQEILRGTDIVAILGRWDRVQLVLEDLQVPHQAIRAQEIKDYGLSPKQVVLVNCEGSIDNTVTEYLQWMVICGGYMATTDWSLVNATTKTFPGVVKGYVKQSTGNDIVVVDPVAPDHPICKGVFREDLELMWWLEIQAFPIQIEDPGRAEVLVDSLQMLTRYGSSAMMVEWSEGLGKVMHSTSHFYLQKEGFAKASSEEERRVFAADHLGLTPQEIRELDAKGAFKNIDNTTPISRTYSMFHLLANFIAEKQRRDLQR
ncbi:MAG TPA: HEAT repeat domain-containing protein [Planctomycetota bacterium]|nr:HEAT repeat domain-containing protein [Planctomycetota bacterium]